MVWIEQLAAELATFFHTLLLLIIQPTRISPHKMSNRNYNNAGNWGRGGKAAGPKSNSNSNNRGNQQPYRGGRLSRDNDYYKVVEKVCNLH